MLKTSFIPTFAETFNTTDMEDNNGILNALAEAKDLIITLSGNLQAAMRIIRHTGTEREYNKTAIFVDESAVIDALHALNGAKISVEFLLER